MPRLRIIAGPNGSGKSHLTRKLRTDYQINWGHYVNADDLETALRNTGRIAFADFGLSLSGDDFKGFYDTHVLKTKAPADFEVTNGILRLLKPLQEPTYFGTLLADYLRYRLLEAGETFSFETVLSGSDKLRFIEKALQTGYRIYLYFVCTENPVINIDRIADRVAKNGHFVPDELVISRYGKTLYNLLPVLHQCRRAYLFDNSGYGPELVAEKLEDGNLSFNPLYIPEWFRKFVLHRI